MDGTFIDTPTMPSGESLSGTSSTTEKDIINAPSALCLETTESLPSIPPALDGPKVVGHPLEFPYKDQQY